MPRVESKHLFNHQLNGDLDVDVVALDNSMREVELSNPDMKTLKDLVHSHDPNVDCTLGAQYVRRYMRNYFEDITQALQGSTDKCTHTEFTVPLRDGNNFEVPVLVHTPTHLVGKTSNAAIVYAHGGGVVAGTAAMFKAGLSDLAIEAGVVFFNVDYRLAPETKFPKNALDFYCAVKHVCENADKLGIDASKIAIAGDSGGGYICFATMVMLAQREEGSLIKVALPGVPMIDDYCFGDLTSMTREERESAPRIKKLWQCIANDLDDERNNPVLFPAKASDELLRKMPPTIIFEKEFDFFITEATRMAHRMKTVGRLLEFCVQPGMPHMATFIPGTNGYRQYIHDYKLAIEQYLL